MIVIDTSALMAILLDEPERSACGAVLADAEVRLISAGTLAECAIVARGPGLSDHMAALLDRLDCDVEPVTASTARYVGEVYARWGKGFHRAALNFGDCFAYELAMRRQCPLLFVGQDFARTDVKSAL